MRPRGASIRQAASRNVPRPGGAIDVADEMPRYFIDLHDGSDFIKDTEGFELPDAPAAHQKLLRIMSRIAAEFPPSPDRQDYLALVRDGRGRTLFRAHLSLEVERVGGT